MKAKEQTLEELLAGAVVHVTPSFQRAYGGPDGVVAPLVEAAAAARPGANRGGRITHLEGGRASRLPLTGAGHRESRGGYRAKTDARGARRM